MPRPGPRPYECVRRAWHSERHHPMRGSLIQEIFRVVNEIHGSSTRMNKEWQEKLPVVVLKAEEIIYSKANSESEYIDLSTLLDRTNDAIDTIIRRDDTTEIGEPLRPCIEAALTLGCTPRRASRSQRNDNPQSYLRQSTWELVESNTGSVGRLAMGNDLGVVPDITSSSKVPCFPLCPGNVPRPSPLGVIQRMRGPYGLDSPSWSYSGYPLYTGRCTQFLRDACGLEVTPSQCGMAGNTVAPPHCLADGTLNNASGESNGERTGSRQECDLSLRLGPAPNPVTGTDDGNIPSDQRKVIATDMTAWCSSKRSLLGEHSSGVREARKKIANAATYRYTAEEDRRHQYATPVMPSSRREGVWRDPGS
ncbi:hypothetical protein MLD38_014598 [Melastoma candidum]|uniref:Uncharacterized protein n=1 Tax=Melastoma candidum TaxID=119954 RepID=A0ACB9RD71_9MYRT|nr:hypothetical protein MLD38_014598 [Melastoma candidum]